MRKKESKEKTFDFSSFRTFLKTGVIAPLTFGMSIEDTFQVLGQPDSIERPYINDEDESPEAKSLTRYCFMETFVYNIS